MALQESDFADKTAAQRRALKLDHFLSDLPARLPVQWQYTHPTRGNIGVRVFGVGYKNELLRLDVEAQLMVNGKRLAVASPMFILNPPMMARTATPGLFSFSPLAAIRQDIEHTVGLMPALKDGQVVDDADPTLTVYPDTGTGSTTVDGRVARGSVDQTFAAIRTGAGNSVNTASTSDNPASLSTTGASTNQFAILRRSIFTFDTSAILSGDTVSSVTFSLYGTGKSTGAGTSPGIDVVDASPAANNTLAASDYGNVGTTVKATMTYASWSASAYNDFTLAIGDVTKAGITSLGTRLTWDTSGTFGGTWNASTAWSFSCNYADQTGTANDPKLVVVYTSATTRRVMLIS